MAITIEVSLWVEGLHFWKNAPPKVHFLKYPHRHRMKIAAGIKVKSTNREIEFYMLQEEVRIAIDKLYDKDLLSGLYLFGERSCEDIAREIMGKVQTHLDYVEVSEDDENRAIVTRGD